MMDKKMKIKRKLSQSEEFEIMKLVLDKVLWLGFIIMGYGLYISITKDYTDGVYYLAAGAVVLIIFAWFIVKEFERIR
ncbi:hypothetical protein JW707_01475 [Candidatus Woesearchaeota archaeon]|nr:hypothetical protein [Candidatus Woesearchaeota archaeon]